MLATAERVLRYARELGFGEPAAQLDELRLAFRSAPERRNELIANYSITTLSARDRAEVLRAFDIAESELEGGGGRRYAE